MVKNPELKSSYKRSMAFFLNKKHLLKTPIWFVNKPPFVNNLITLKSLVYELTNPKFVKPI